MIPIIFTHIPKCGGVSVRTMLGNAAIQSGISKDRLFIPGKFGRAVTQNLHKVSLEQDFKKLKNKNFLIVADHIQYNAPNIKKIFNLLDELYYLTIFRNPITRFISNYYYFYFTDFLPQYNCKGIDFEDLDVSIQSAIIQESANIQVAFLAGKPWNYKVINVVEEDLSTAKENLLKYSCWGYLELMNLTVQTFNCQLPEYLSSSIVQVPHLNKGAKEEITTQLKESTTTRIKQANLLDISLYNFSLDVFQERFMSPVFKLETNLNDLMNLKID